VGRREICIAMVSILTLLASCSSGSPSRPQPFSSPSATHQATARVVTVLFYDRQGNRLTPAQARAVMTNGSAGWANDTLLDPATLQDVVEQPLHTSGGSLVFDVPAQPVALALNWPTTRGYSLVILDDGGGGFTSPGTVNFTYQAALDAQRRLDAMVAARPTYVASTGFDAADAHAASLIQRATQATDESDRGRFGQRALDQVNVAGDLLLSEFGPADAHTRLAASAPWFGATLDTTEDHEARLDLARATTDPFGWVRIVFDRNRPPSDYVEMVKAAKARGLKVMGEPVDSYYAKHYTRPRYLRRFRSYVNAFPRIDAWEVGNEVNGRWLGPGIDRKVADVASWVQAHSSATVVLTLYWQIGTDAAKWSTFNWVRANLPASTRRDLDVVLLSSYVEDAPLGMAFDEVMRTLHAEFPDQLLGIGELDYWAPDTSRAWWAFDRGDPTGAGRHEVAAQYYAASLGYPYAIGGCFWWYFAEEAPPDAQLRASIRAVVRDVVKVG
jgi:hypothetical protein